MNIAFVTPEFISSQNNFDGGLANYLHRVCLALKSLGHETHVFVPASESRTFDFQGITVHEVKFNDKDWMFQLACLLSKHQLDYSLSWIYKSHTLNKALAAQHKRKSFDIVQYASYGATAYSRVKSIPAVARISSYEPMHREGRGVTDPSPDEVKYAQIELESLMNTDAIFGPSKLTADRVAKDSGRKVEVIETPFIMEVDNWDETIYQQLKGKKYLLFWGTLWKLKGVDVIAEMLPDLLAKHPELYFVFVGKDFGSLPNIQAAAKQFSDRVIYLGKLPHTQLYPIIKHAHLAVLPSLYDNFPNTCIEGMALSKVVIGTRETSFEQIIDDGRSGFLVKKNDPQDLLAKIEQLLQMPMSELERIGEAARKRTELLAPDVVVKQLLELYRNTISRFNRK